MFVGNPSQLFIDIQTLQREGALRGFWIKLDERDRITLANVSLSCANNTMVCVSQAEFLHDGRMINYYGESSGIIPIDFDNDGLKEVRRFVCADYLKSYPERKFIPFSSNMPSL